MVEGMAERGLHINPVNMYTGSNSGTTTWELIRKGFGPFPMSDNIAAQFDAMLSGR